MTKNNFPSEQSASETVLEDIREYGKYTITNRALPDVRDGLKPVQRLILWSLWTMKRTFKDIPAKCAQVASHTTGNYHPHGEEAAYQSLVNLRWNRYPLVVGAGNFGNPNKLEDPGPAAARYPETKMQEISERFFDDIHVAQMEPNYNNELEQPVVLPSRIPTLLVNGGEGIAMGIATKLPPHNLTEILNAAEALLGNEELELDELLKFVKGPDAGTGVLVSKKKDLVELYATGRGKVAYCCTYDIEDGNRGSKKLVITGKAPGFNGSRFLKETLLLKDKKLILAPANDESSLETGTRITIEYKDPQVVRERLLPLLNTSVSYQMYSLDPDGNPRLYGLKGMLQDWLDFRRDIDQKVLRARAVELRKKIATEVVRLKAIRQIDDVVEVVKTATTVKAALAKLCVLLDVEEWQAEIVLNTQLRSLMRMTAADLKSKIRELKTNLKQVKADLKDIDGVVLRSIQEIRDKYGDARGTRLRKSLDDLQDEGETSYFIGALSKGSKVESFTEPPIKSKASWPYADFIRSEGEILVVQEDNTVHVANVSYLDKLDLSRANVVGLASSKHSFSVVVVSRRGKYVCFSPDQKRKSFNAFRGLASKDRIFQAVGVKEGEEVYVCFENGECEQLDLSTVTRPNVKPRRVRKEIGKVRAVVVRGDGDVLIGTETLSEETVASIGNKSVWRVGQENMVIEASSGKRTVKSQEEVLDLLEKGTKPSLIVDLD